MHERTALPNVTLKTNKSNHSNHKGVTINLCRNVCKANGESSLICQVLRELWAKVHTEVYDVVQYVYVAAVSVKLEVWDYIIFILSCYCTNTVMLRGL